MGSLSTTRAKGVSIKAAGINVVGSIISKNAGPVMLDAGTNEISLGAASLISSAGTLTINAASLKQLNGSKVYANGGSDIVVTVDNIALASAANSWNGAGKFVLQPITAGRRIDVGRTGNGFELTTDEVGGIAAGLPASSSVAAARSTTRAKNPPPRSPSATPSSAVSGRLPLRSRGRRHRRARQSHHRRKQHEHHAPVRRQYHRERKHRR